MEYDVVVWLDDLSDGSKCYAAVCPAIDHAHGQGDTEEEALVDVADTMAVYLYHQPDRIKTGQVLQVAWDRLTSEIVADGLAYWIRSVAPVRNWVPA